MKGANISVIFRPQTANFLVYLGAIPTPALLSPDQLREWRRQIDQALELPALAASFNPDKG